MSVSPQSRTDSISRCLHKPAILRTIPRNQLTDTAFTGYDVNLDKLTGYYGHSNTLGATDAAAAHLRVAVCVLRMAHANATAQDAILSETPIANKRMSAYDFLLKYLPESRPFLKNTDETVMVNELARVANHLPEEPPSRDMLVSLSTDRDTLIKWLEQSAEASESQQHPATRDYMGEGIADPVHNHQRKPMLPASHTLWLHAINHIDAAMSLLREQAVAQGATRIPPLPETAIELYQLDHTPPGAKSLPALLPMNDSLAPYAAQPDISAAITDENDIVAQARHAKTSEARLNWYADATAQRVMLAESLLKAASNEASGRKKYASPSIEQRFLDTPEVRKTLHAIKEAISLTEALIESGGAPARADRQFDRMDGQMEALKTLVHRQFDPQKHPKMPRRQPKDATPYKLAHQALDEAQHLARQWQEQHELGLRTARAR